MESTAGQEEASIEAQTTAGVSIPEQVGAVALQPDLEPTGQVDDVLVGPNNDGEDPIVWLRRYEIARSLGLSLSATKEASDSLQEERPEHFRVGDSARDANVVFVSSVVLDRFPPPKDWGSDESLANELKVSVSTVQRLANRLRMEYEGHYRRCKAASDIEPHEYFSDTVAGQIRASVTTRRQKHAGRRQPTATQIDFETLTEDLKEGESLEAQEFEKLVNVFGAESAADVLYLFNKNYKNKIPVPVVKSFLADYLGEFLVKQGELDLDNINHALPFLHDKKLKQALGEVIKRHCLKTYNLSIRDNPNQDSFDVIYDYLEDVRNRTGNLDSEELREVLETVEDYYLSLFEIQVPDYMVESLTEGRTFPDLNQRINIKETLDKKRMLIGDDPGMGKTGSAIMAKEISGAKCAVVVAPSQVMNERVWQMHLSDMVAEDGEQVGYFKPGEAPRVLTVGKTKHLKDVTAEDYDYILLSEEMMTEEYVEILKTLDFDMLIVDEAHKYKNILEGVRSNLLIDLASKLDRPNDYLMMLTATAAPNKVVDIALAFRLLFPKRYSQYSNADLVHHILQGDVIDLRNILLPHMQLKSLEDSHKMPELHEEVVYVELSDEQREAYEIILDEWEMEPQQKIQFLRQMLLNPAVLDATPDIPSAKTERVGADLRKAFETQDKAILFVNNYVTGILKGPNTIVPGLDLPDDVQVYSIFGDIPKTERHQIMQGFQNGDGKRLLLLSGQTVSVGVDLSAAERSDFYNEPWTLTEKIQELGRSNRPNRKGDLYSKTYIVPGTIEEGIHAYIKAKYQAVQKLLYGIPLSDIEKEMVKSGEENEQEGLAVNPELAIHYFPARERLNRIFGRVPEIGEEKMLELRKKHGQEYASTYLELTSRSYQANASRLAGTLIDRFITEQGKSDDIRILDIGSGPEMLRRHIADEYADKVVSLDINSDHFLDTEGEAITGALASLPVSSGSVDYANMSLTFHYTEWVPSRGRYERLEGLMEMNRVLKPGGRAVIIMPYSLNLKDNERFGDLAQKLGFRVVSDYTGQVQTDQTFKGQLVTLEKVNDCSTDLSQTLAGINKNVLLKRGLVFESQKASVRDTAKIATHYVIEDQGEIKPTMNAADSRVLQEEQKLLRDMKKLRDRFGGIKEIPDEEIINRGYARIFNGKSYVLHKRLKHGNGAIVIRDYS